MSKENILSQAIFKPSLKKNEYSTIFFVNFCEFLIYEKINLENKKKTSFSSTSMEFESIPNKKMFIEITEYLKNYVIKNTAHAY